MNRIPMPTAAIDTADTVLDHMEPARGRAASGLHRVCLDPTTPPSALAEGGVVILDPFPRYGDSAILWATADKAARTPEAISSWADGARSPAQQGHRSGRPLT